jgi:HEAT repeat protein
MSLDLNDDTAVQLLLDTLQHPDEVRVLVALHLLSEAPPGDWLPRLTPLLSHSDAGVRQVTARVLARSGSSAEAELLLRLGQTPGEPGRAEAIEAYCALRKEEALAQILPFLSEPDPAVQRATVVNLIRYGGLDGILPAVEVLKAMLSSPQTRVRLEATRALGELQIQTFYQPLIPLLDDPQLMVQLEAIRAAGAVRSLYLTPYLVQKLGNPATRGPASEALIQFGPAVEPLLAQTLADPGQDQAIRQAIPRILQKMASSQAAAILLNHFEEPDRVVRGAIFAALIRLREAGVHFEIEKQRIHEALTLEFGYYYEVFVWRTDLNLGPATSTGLLGEALTVRLNERLDRIFFLLELLYSVKTIDIIRAVLKDKDTSQRANAIELLDNIVTREIKMLLLPLIELPAEQVCDLARQRFGVRGLPWSERLGVLAGYPDPWLRSCAIFEIGQLRLHDLIEPILASQEVDDGLVRETAQLTRQRLTVPDQAQG